MNNLSPHRWWRYLLSVHDFSPSCLGMIHFSPCSPPPDFKHSSIWPSLRSAKNVKKAAKGVRFKSGLTPTSPLLLTQPQQCPPPPHLSSSHSPSSAPHPLTSPPHTAPAVPPPSHLSWHSPSSAPTPSPLLLTEPQQCLPPPYLSSSHSSSSAPPPPPPPLLTAPAVPPTP